MKMNKQIVFAIIAVVMIVLGAVFVLWPRVPKGYSGKPESITIGRPLSDSGTIIFTAEEQHLFAANGIMLTQKTYDTGLAAINGLLNNEIAFSGSAEYPVVVKALENASISIIASFARTYNEYVVGRINKGIRNEADLRGKRVGLPRGALPEFYLGRFLDLHGMSIREVTLANLTPKQAVDAFANGTVDAVVVWEPYVSKIKEQQTNRIVSWSMHSGQAQYAVLVGRNDWIRQHPEIVKRVLNSLAQAEEYVVRHPTEAKAILKKWYQYDDAYVATVWTEHQFSLSLDQSLITAMEDEARWMIKNNLTRKKQIPDFMNYIYVDGLKAVKPEAVMIIR